jgi:hypothetical protein
MGILTVEQIAEMQEVSIDFVKKIQDALGKETQSESAPPKQKIKKRNNNNTES